MRQIKGIPRGRPGQARQIRLTGTHHRQFRRGLGGVDHMLAGLAVERLRHHIR